MKDERNFVFRVGWLYGIVVLLANLFANVVQVVIPSPIDDSFDFVVWRQFLSDNSFLSWISMLSYVVPTAFCIGYAYKNLRNLACRKKTFLSIPLVFSFFTVVGWGINFLIELVALLYVRSKYGIDIANLLLTSLIYMAFSIVTVFTVSYLQLDLINRKYVLPRLFPEGHLSEVSGSHKSQFALLLILCFVVMTLLPVFYLCSSSLAIQQNNGIEVHKGMLIMAGVFVLISLGITIGLALLITQPLKELTVQAQKIQNGEYNSRSTFVSNDEMGMLADSFNDMAASLAEKEFMRTTFGKIVDPSVRDYLMSGNVSLGGESRDVSVLFCDIRSFTAMSERMQAEEVVLLLNEYFTALSKCITDNHGIVNKYIGDAIMAIFGAPVQSVNHAYDAFRASQDMRAALVKLNEEFVKKGRPELSFGIGIHSGLVLAGNIGAQNRMEYTVIGDTVNTASRIESLCKTYHTDLLISEETVKRMGLPEGTFTLVDQSSIRGKQEKINLFTCGA